MDVQIIQIFYLNVKHQIARYSCINIQNFIFKTVWYTELIIKMVCVCPKKKGLCDPTNPNDDVEWDNFSAYN